MEQSDPIVERAVALAGSDADRPGALGELIQLAGNDQARLEVARQALVRRIRLRSDDFAASGGLTLVNAALSRLGRQGDFTWKPRGHKPQNQK